VEGRGLRSPFDGVIAQGWKNRVDGKYASASASAWPEFVACALRNMIWWQMLISGSLIFVA
jgi:hypothetical protein